MVVIALLAIGAAFGSIDLWHGVDGSSHEMWRECDVAAVARNYSREGMHLLYPQIDWRGNGPGYVEMEFPIYPYLIAIGYRVLGFHEVIGRVISFVCFLVTLLLVLRLAEYTMPPPGSAVATFYYAVSPLAIRLANAIQPEPLMMAAYVGAVYTYVRWLEEDRWLWYWWAMALTALAVLAKAPAAHVGLVFIFFTAWRRGWRLFFQPRLWVFAILALAPSALWYAHAHQFYLTYGNSLGASNHHHVVGLAALTHAHYALGIASLELHFVWRKAGVIAIALGTLFAWRYGPRLRVFGYGYLWYAAVLVYYIVIAGTSADEWARYYHIVSMPPAALLMGGVTTVLWMHRRSLAGAGQKALAGATACAVLYACVTAVRLTWDERHPSFNVPVYQTARAFAPLIPPGVLIAASGEDCVTPTESAYNTPWFFYWTDHKGFTPCVQDHTMPIVRSLIDKGVGYFIVEQRVLVRLPEFDTDMRRTYPVVAETPVAVLFKLRS
ncbi:MAG TPA: glycosyltransferase family 39 protein [Gemmatimonadaceae bacterium]|nr:glycosyltransferase family 39 protein [Gemmatimonadaceae bacterium]